MSRTRRFVPHDLRGLDGGFEQRLARGLIANPMLDPGTNDEVWGRGKRKLKRRLHKQARKEWGYGTLAD